MCSGRGADVHCGICGFPSIPRFMYPQHFNIAEIRVLLTISVVIEFDEQHYLIFFLKK